MPNSLEELQETERHFNHALEMVRLGYWYWVPATHELYWSRECYKLLGHDPDRGLTPNLELFFRNIEPADHEYVQAMLKTVSEEGSAPDLEYRVNLPDNEAINVTARAEVIRNPDGSPKYLFGTLQDVTESRKQKVQLQDALRKAEAASEAKSEFLASISHEFRTPLNAILGYAQLLILDDELTENHKANLKDVIDASGHLLDMINNILNFSAISKNEFGIEKEKIDLNSIVTECVALTTPTAHHYSVELKTDLDRQKPKDVVLDKLRLKLALTNLITNAIKYNRPGGFVNVRTEDSKDSFKIIVKDNGLGISKDSQDELFEPFNRLGKEKGPIPGTGIGLSIVKRSIEAISGKIRIESEEGKGSTFSVILSK